MRLAAIPKLPRLSGVPVKRVLLLVYAVSGVMCGFGGLIHASRYDVGDPSASVGHELLIIAAVVVGGTSLAGGEGKDYGYPRRRTHVGSHQQRDVAARGRHLLADGRLWFAHPGSRNRRPPQASRVETRVAQVGIE